MVELGKQLRLLVSCVTSQVSRAKADILPKGPLPTEFVWNVRRLFNRGTARLIPIYFEKEIGSGTKSILIGAKNRTESTIGAIRRNTFLAKKSGEKRTKKRSKPTRSSGERKTAT